MADVGKANMWNVRNNLSYLTKNTPLAELGHYFNNFTDLKATKGGVKHVGSIPTSDIPFQQAITNFKSQKSKIKNRTNQPTNQPNSQTQRARQARSLLCGAETTQVSVLQEWKMVKRKKAAFTPFPHRPVPFT